MTIPLLLKRMPDKYLAGFQAVNQDLLTRLSTLIAVLCLVINAIISAVLDPYTFPRQSRLLFLEKLPMIVTSLAILLATIVKPLKGTRIVFSYALLLFILVFTASMMLAIQNMAELVNSWVLFIIIIVGVYPIPLGRSLILFFVSFLYFLVSYLQGGRFADEYMQLVFTNSMIAAGVSAAL